MSKHHYHYSVGFKRKGFERKACGIVASNKQVFVGNAYQDLIDGMAIELDADKDSIFVESLTYMGKGY